MKRRPLSLGFLAGLLGASLAVAQPVEPAKPAATNVWKFLLNPQSVERFKFDNFYNASRSTPAIASDGTVYLGTLNGTFFAVTPAGKEKWRFKTGREIKSSPAIADDGTIYFGSRDHDFYALTPGGALKWKFVTGAWVDASPALAADGTIYFGGWDKQFYALHPDGSLRWKFSAGAIVDSSPAVAADGTIYFGAHDKLFYALNPDGKVRWTFKTDGEILSSPALGAGGVIYFSSLDGNLYALNSDGSERWRYHSGSITESSPVVDADGNICIGISYLNAVISPDGKKLWHSGSPVPMEVSAAMVAGRYYFPVPWNGLEAVTHVDKRLWRAELDTIVSASVMVGADGVIYAVAGDCLYSVRPPGAALPPANSPWPMFRANARHTGRAGN